LRGGFDACPVDVGDPIDQPSKGLAEGDYGHDSEDARDCGPNERFWIHGQTFLHPNLLYIK
jgi:hypothetical protein